METLVEHDKVLDLCGRPFHDSAPKVHTILPPAPKNFTPFHQDSGHFSCTFGQVLVEFQAIFRSKSTIFSVVFATVQSISDCSNR